MQAFDSCSYQKQAIEAATDLGYGVRVIWKIENAKSDAEISRIMKTAREQKLN